MVLESTRLTIRNLKEEDLNDFVSYRSDPEVARYQGYEVFNKKTAFEFIVSQKENSWMLSEKWMQLAIIEKESGKLIGDCAIRLKENDLTTAEVGCTISPLYQQKGFASETLNNLVNYLLKEVGLKKITAVIDAENKASAKLMDRLGFIKEGEEIVKFKGQWCKEFKYVFQTEQNG